jgi:hypothetical protein
LLHVCVPGQQRCLLAHPKLIERLGDTHRCRAQLFDDIAQIQSQRC